LENTFQGMRDGMQRLVRFLVNVFSKYFGYKQIDIYMSELKMADDVQRQQILMNLEAAGKVSTTRMLSELNFDFREEEKLKKDEFGTKLTGFIRDSLLQAKAQGEAGLVSLDYQMRAQKTQMEEQAKLQQAAATQGMAIDPNTGQPMQIDPATGQPMSAGAQQPGMPGGAGAGQPGAGGQIDPTTGLPIDPNSGLPVDPSTGMLLDVQNGVAIDPNTGTQYDLNTGQPIQGQPPAQTQPAGGSLAPGQAPTDTSLAPPQGALGGGGLNPNLMNPMEQAQMAPTVPEQRRMEQEQVAAAGLSSSNMPPDLKAMVTRYATALIFTDVATQRQIISQMAQETPMLAQLVQRRMMELTQLKPAIAQPDPMDLSTLPASMKPTTAGPTL
jgi:hypothetical protein